MSSLGVPLFFLSPGQLVRHTNSDWLLSSPGVMYNPCLLSPSTVFMNLDARTLRCLSLHAATTFLSHCTFAFVTIEACPKDSGKRALPPPRRLGQ